MERRLADIYMFNSFGNEASIDIDTTVSYNLLVLQNVFK